MSRHRDAALGRTRKLFPKRDTKPDLLKQNFHAASTGSGFTSKTPDGGAGKQPRRSAPSLAEARGDGAARVRQRRRTQEVPMTVRGRGAKSFVQAVFDRTGKSRVVKDRYARKKKRRAGYVAANGPTASDEAAIGTGGVGGGGAGGGA